MAIKHIICMGIGFASDGIKYIPTFGYDITILTQSSGAGTGSPHWRWEFYEYRGLE